MNDELFSAKYQPMLDTTIEGYEAGIVDFDMLLRSVAMIASKEAVEREREECAALAENKYATEWHPFYHLAGLGIAKAIRARSESEK